MRIIGYLAAVLAVVGFAATGAQADTIDFESDPAGDKGPSYVSVDSPILTFSDTSLTVANFGNQAIGQGLATFGSNLGLNMDFSTAVTSLSMVFGNDDPGFAEDRAVLTVFNNNVQVGQTVLIYNKNDAADQTIGISGVGQFDRAHLIYVDSNFQAVSALAEVVDNVQFNAVPEPGSMALLGLGILGLAYGRRRKQRSA